MTELKTTMPQARRRSGPRALRTSDKAGFFSLRRGEKRKSVCLVNRPTKLIKCEHLMIKKRKYFIAI